MQHRYLAKKDPELLKTARNVFGRVLEQDFVVEAYTTERLYDYNEEAKKESFERIKIAPTYNESSDCLDGLDGVLLVLCNGKKLKFTCSEWATISEMTEEVIFVD